MYLLFFVHFLVQQNSTYVKTGMTASFYCVFGHWKSENEFEVIWQPCIALLAIMKIFTILLRPLRCTRKLVFLSFVDCKVQRREYINDLTYFALSSRGIGIYLFCDGRCWCSIYKLLNLNQTHGMITCIFGVML